MSATCPRLYPIAKNVSVSISRGDNARIGSGAQSFSSSNAFGSRSAQSESNHVGFRQLTVPKIHHRLSGKSKIGRIGRLAHGSVSNIPDFRHHGQLRLFEMRVLRGVTNRGPSSQRDGIVENSRGQQGRPLNNPDRYSAEPKSGHKCHSRIVHHQRLHTGKRHGRLLAFREVLE